ncbi:proline-rich protein 19 [Lissotriton helveticus]
MSQCSGNHEPARPSEHRGHLQPRGDVDGEHPGSSSKRVGQAYSSTTEKPRIQRRKTKRERNHAKFRRTSLEQRGSDEAFQRVQISQRCAWSASATCLKSICRSEPAIITKNRLTQHLGMFNREVKSADIGRLLAGDSDLAELALEKSMHHQDSTVTVEEARPVNHSPEERVEPSQTAVQEMESLSARLLNENRWHPNNRTPATSPCSEYCSTHSTLSSLLGLPVKGTTTSQSISDQDNTLIQRAPLDQRIPLSDKENTPLGRAQCGQSKGSNDTDRQNPDRVAEVTRSVPVKEVVVQLLTILNTPPAFVGRSLINERQQSIMALLVDRHGSVPDISGLTACRKLDCSSTPGAHKGDHGTGSSGSRCRNDKCRHPHVKRMRQQSPPLAFCEAPQSSSTPSRPQSDEETPGQKEDLDVFEELSYHGHQQHFMTSPINSDLTSMLPRSLDHSTPLFSTNMECLILNGDHRRMVSRNRELFEQSIPPVKLSRTVRDRRSNSERNTDPLQQGTKRIKAYNLPFKISDSSATHTSQFSYNSNCNVCPNTSEFPLHQPTLHRHRKCSPETQWRLKTSEGTQEPTQDVFSHWQPQTGCKSLGRICQEYPTSFNEVTSNWSSKTQSGGGEKTVRKAFDLVHLCEREVPLGCQKLDKDSWAYPLPQPNSNSMLQHHPSLQHPKEVYLHGSEVKEHVCGTSASVHWSRGGILRDKRHVADIRACRDCMVSWDPRSSLIREPLSSGDHMEQRCICKGAYLHNREHWWFPEQSYQLPISSFPPSEELEQGLLLATPTYSTSAGPLLEQTSPESWVFPRMKLY